MSLRCEGIFPASQDRACNNYRCGIKIISIIIVSLNLMLSLRGLPPPDLHVGDGKYYCHYAEEVAEAGAVICRNLNWSD